MWKSRARYLLVLLGTTVFFICFNGYLSLYVLVLSLLLPVVSLGVSLPGMLGLRASLSLGSGKPHPGAVESYACARKGDTIPLQLEVWSALPFSSGRARAKVTVENTFTGQREEEVFSFTSQPQRQAFAHQLTSKTCGQVVCRLERLWVCDYLGLFALPVGRRQTATATFWPAVIGLEPEVRDSSVPDSEGERYSQKKPGDDPTELFALRDYQEGDRLSRVHWKLSQKLGKPLVKELGMPLSDHLLFLLDLNGTGAQGDLLLDAFASLSSFLAQGEHAHRVLYLAQGQLACREVSQPEDLLPLWQEILAGGSRAPLPSLERAPLPEGISHGLYLCCEPQGAVELTFANRYPAAALTVLCAGQRESLLPGDGEHILLRADKLPQTLNGLIL